MKLLLCLIILIFVVVSNAVNINVNTINQHEQMNDMDTPLRDMFNHWTQKHSKVYKDMEEFEMRFTNFKENMKKSNRLNAMHRGKAHFNANKFSDLSHEEFSSHYLMKNFKGKPISERTYIEEQEAPHYSLVGGLKQSKSGVLEPMYVVDWRKKGLVTPVKDQGQCGSCYIFSATEQVESAWIMAGNKPLILSEQQAVDCDMVDAQCGGGDPANVYEYFAEAGGVSLEADYPYTATDGTCVNMTRAVPVKSFKYVTQGGDEDTLVKAIANTGPISICVDASTWQNYAGGIITTGCDTDIDHCVQVVGLDVDKSDPNNPIPYYIVRNSWGTSWGEKGFIYIEVGKDLCGITSESTVVEV